MLGVQGVFVQRFSSEAMEFIIIGEGGNEIIQIMIRRSLALQRVRTSNITKSPHGIRLKTIGEGGSHFHAYFSP